MTFVFLSDCYNHHQSSFSEAMYRLTQENYYFIATKPIGQMRRNLGWGIDDEPVFLKKWYLDDNSRIECEKLINSADVVITGSAPEYLLSDRIKNKKMIIRYSERLYKKFSFLDIVKTPVRFFRFRKLFNHDNMYLLCASAFAAADYAITGSFKGKTYKWGYFPSTKVHDIERLIEKKTAGSIIWVARFIDWKHPEVAVKLAKRLMDCGISFDLNLIGTGEKEDEIAKYIEDYKLQSTVHILGSMRPEKVREYMEKSQVFIFTSDRNEGWGAVLNEAMNSGCAAVANRNIGAVPYLVHNGINGYCYETEDELFEYVKQLLTETGKSAELGKAAYNTIAMTWNAEVAAERLIKLTCELVEKGYSDSFSEGPCSIAKIH